jgi:hypothetical protein
MHTKENPYRKRVQDPLRRVPKRARRYTQTVHKQYTQTTNKNTCRQREFETHNGLISTIPKHTHTHTHTHTTYTKKICRQGTLGTHNGLISTIPTHTHTTYTKKNMQARKIRDAQRPNKPLINGTRPARVDALDLGNGYGFESAQTGIYWCMWASMYMCMFRVFIHAYTCVCSKVFIRYT